MNVFRRHQGFTLLELVFAIGLVAIGVVSMLMSFPAIARLRHAGWDMKKAQILAADKMETLLSSSGSLEPGEEKRPELPACKRIWSLRHLEGGLSRLTVTVIWKARERVMQVSLDTLVPGGGAP